MTLIEKLLGKKPKTAPNIASEIETQTAAIKAARAKIEVAQAARKTAIDDLDAAGHKACDEEIAEAGREIERRENAIEKLTAAHAERVDLDKREAFRRADAELAAEGRALEARIAVDYPEAAKTIVALMGEIAAFRVKHRAMRERANAVGEKLATRDAEEFRGAVEIKVSGAPWRFDDLEKKVGDLPPLKVGDAPFHVGREFVVPPRIPLVDRM